jgi:Domain of unknown function (DUF4123)
VSGVFGKACSAEVCLHQQGGLKVQSFIEASAHNPQWHWYAIADAAQHRDLPGALVRNSGLQTRCLFDAPVDSALAAQSPHLVELEHPSDQAPSWKWIKRYANGKPCVTVIASNVGFDALFAHLQRFTEVFLPDGKQHATLIHPMAGWWYWDRDGNLRSIKIITGTTEHADTPLQLTQKQVDGLVEASVPDHVLSHIELNQPQLLRDIELAQRYGLMRKHLLNARQLKLEAMGDLVNYVCAALIYQDQFDTNPEIAALLEKVKGGELPLVKALEQMP